MPAEAPAGLDKGAVARRFNRSAATYDSACRVQRRMAERLARRLEGMPPRPRILELGCGTGYLTGLLARLLPCAEILAVDLAERMVEAASGRVRSARVQFRVSDAESDDLGGREFDLVVSNATIQWFDDPASSLPRLAETLRPGGLMLHSTFGPATLTELREAFAASGTAGPAGPPLRPGERWKDILAAGGLAGVECRRRREVEHYASAAALLAELSATGVTTRPTGDSGPLAPRRLLGGLRRYEQAFRVPQGVPATWETLELSAVRPG